MSFGISIGDFLAVIQLANNVRKEFNGAPGQFDGISNELRSLSITLQDIEIKLSDCIPDAGQQTKLANIVSNCRNVLSELENTLSKYKVLESPSPSWRGKATAVWKRLRWEPEDVRELRGRITSNVTLLHTFVWAISSQAINETKRGVDQLNQRHDDQIRSRVLDWLSPTDYSFQQSDFINRRQPGTGQWLLDSERYKEFVQRAQAILFGPGIPGAGKTMCAAIVIDDLTTRFGCHSDIGIAFIFLSFRRQNEQTAENLLANLLKQLIQKKSSLPDEVKELHTRFQERGRRPSVDDISKALEAVVKSYAKVFIVIDALDECQTSDGCRTRLLDEIFKIQALSKMNIFATSRLSEISGRFQRSLSLEISASEGDVRRYLEGNMFRLPGFVSRSPALQEEIKSTLLQLTQGMFLLAQLHFDSLVGKKSPSSIRKALSKLPTGSDDHVYDHAYRSAMDRIEGQLQDQKELAKQTLSWVTCARKPLTVSELQHALSVEEGDTTFDAENLPQIEDLLPVCAGLVTVDHKSNDIRLIHYTAQEYFDRTQTEWFTDAEAYIATTCVTYLSFSDFGLEDHSFHNHHGFEKIRTRIVEFCLSYPLYRYASLCWSYHCRRARSMPRMVMAFLGNTSRMRASAVCIYSWISCFEDSISISGLWDKASLPIHGLNLAAWLGFEDAVLELLQLDQRFQDAGSIPPLIFAIANGQLAAVRLLLSEGVDVETKSKDGRTALCWAATFGQESIVQLLLDWGANVNIRDKRSTTALQVAARRGNLTICKILLDKGPNTHVQDRFGRSALHHALNLGYQELVQMLLDRGANLNSRNVFGYTVLEFAGLFCKREIVQLLLNRGADINFQGKFGQKARHYVLPKTQQPWISQQFDQCEPINNTLRYCITEFSFVLDLSFVPWSLNMSNDHWNLIKFHAELRGDTSLEDPKREARTSESDRGSLSRT